MAFEISHSLQCGRIFTGRTVLGLGCPSMINFHKSIPSTLLRFGAGPPGEIDITEEREREREREKERERKKARERARERARRERREERGEKREEKT